MVKTRTAILVCLLALVGVGAADTATAMDADLGDASVEEPSSTSFRICAPPYDVGPVAGCSVEV